MSKSKSNTNGRYFEYLISNYIQNKFNVSLSDRALGDQKRDQEKEQYIARSDLDVMHAALKPITNWIQKKIKLDNRTSYDRLPDKGSKLSGAGHSDIELNRDSKSISHSLKFNHSAVFHGRPYTLPQACGFSSNSKEANEFRSTQLEECKKVREFIKPGTQFASNGILEEYTAPWAKFMQSIVFNQAAFLNKYATDQDINSNLFNSIIGGGKNKYRIILDSKKKQLHFEDITNLCHPTSFKAEVKQEGISYQFYLVITFNNGLILMSRHKHDSRYMTNHGTQVLIKPDWQVADWGDSGMRRDIKNLST